MPKLTEAERQELHTLLIALEAEMAQVVEHIGHSNHRWQAVATFLQDHMDEGQRQMQFGRALEGLGLRPEMITVLETSRRYMEAAAKVTAGLGIPPAKDDLMGSWK